MSYNLRLYGREIDQQCPGLAEGERRWLANQCSKVYKGIEDEYPDNFRVCLLTDGRTTEDYEQRVANGCCGFADQVVTNPLTGHSFMIGFNFGH